MSPYERHYIAESETDAGSLRAAAAALLLIVAFAVFGYVAPSDPRIARLTPCAVLSEQQVSDVFGQPMRLMPTSGAVCHYVATNGADQSSLFVVARADVAFPLARGDDIALSGVGDAALLTSDALYVRSHAHAYKLIVAPQSPHESSGTGELLRLAAMMGDRTVARSR